MNSDNKYIEVTNHKKALSLGCSMAPLRLSLKTTFDVWSLHVCAQVGLTNLPPPSHTDYPQVRRGHIVTNHLPHRQPHVD